jgi:hypothetical protein
MRRRRTVGRRCASRRAGHDWWSSCANVGFDRLGEPIERVGPHRLERLRKGPQALPIGTIEAPIALTSKLHEAGIYHLEPLDDGRATRASIRIRGEARGMYGLPGALLGPMVRRSVAGDLRRLRKIFERELAAPT